MSPHEIAHLVDRYGAPLLLYARQWCSAPEDVVQEAFVKLVSATVPPRNPVPWLYRVVRNAAIDEQKKQKRRHQRELSVARPTQWFVEPEIDGLDAEAAVAALNALPLDQREVIVARLWGGMSFDQIGEVVGCSASTAFRRFDAGLMALRRELDAPCPETSPKI